MENKNNASLLDVLVVFVLAVSIVSVVSLVLNLFRPNIALMASLIITVSIFCMQRHTWKIVLNIKSIHASTIILLLLIGLFFRSEPYHYIAGGQDQGVYVNMSQYYAQYGKIFVIDELRESLPEALKTTYDAENLSISVRVEDQNEGFYLPGVYVKDQQKSVYVFQFYPLHPLWMSLFGELFGDTYRVYSLVFFSLLSLLAFYLLAFELSKSRTLAFCAGFLLAINPLHAFFSKFPVTEVVALTFTLLSFYYLLKYYHLAKAQHFFPVYLFLSALLMLSMFFTRISGFMYLPFFYLILIVVDIFCENKLMAKQLKYYLCAVFIFYALSVVYGLVFSYPYSSDIYRLSFQRLLGNNWQAGLIVLVAIFVFIYIIILAIVNSIYSDKLKYFVFNSRRLIPYVFLTVFCLGVYKVYQLGFTETYIENEWYNIRWHAAQSGWMAFIYWSDFVITEYLSPFIVLVFSYLVFTQVKNNNLPRTLLLLFILLFFVHISLLQWFIPYQYYYARYLLSEALPFILLFTITGLAGIKKYKKVAYSFVGLSAIYMFIFTSFQLRAREMEGLHASLLTLKKHIGNDDILMLEQRFLHFNGELKTTLRFYYDLNVLSVNNEQSRPFINFFVIKISVCFF